MVPALPLGDGGSTRARSPDRRHLVNWLRRKINEWLAAIWWSY
ncbi:hypothetical protein I544_4547 [Mycobacteroides abscessus subsp. bolletii 103]|nr:hypothetical protein I544_4547 [Mycobacteroides abscessus subsp. bolletii 103]